MGKQLDLFAHLPHPSHDLLPPFSPEAMVRFDEIACTRYYDGSDLKCVAEARERKRAANG